MESIKSPSEKNQLLSKLVVEKIKQAILNKEILPGEILPSENEMVQSLGVSKSSVREAIKMLEAVGVVEIKRGVGTVLSKNPTAGYINILIFQMMLNGSDEKQLIEFRKMFEIAYTKVAIQNATQDDIENMYDCIELHEAAIKKGEYTVESDLMFHYYVLKATHNSFMISLGEAVNTLFKSPIANAIKGKAARALEDHKAIYNAIKEKDEQAAATAIEFSLKDWRL